MHEVMGESPFRCVLTLKPLLDFWEKELALSDPAWRLKWNSVQERLAQVPELMGPVADLSLLQRNRDLVGVLLSVVFPPTRWNTELVGALVPFTLQPAFVSEPFRHHLLNTDGSFRGRLHVDWDEFVRARLLRFYLLILRRCYGFTQDLDFPLIQIVPDPETGLERHFRFTPDLRFVDVHVVGKLREFDDSERARIAEHLTEPDVLGEFLPPENFELHGFTAIHGIDVTQSEVLSALQRDLIDKGSIFSREGFERLQQRIRILFRRPNLVAGVAAVQGDQVLILNTGCRMSQECICICSDSEHIPVSQLKGSVFERAVEERRVLRIRDLAELPARTGVEDRIVGSGIRSFLVVPLFYQDELLGSLDFGSPIAGDLGPMDLFLAEQLRPLFSLALKKALDEFGTEIQGVIKERCTAVHPSVEWRFRGAAFRHLERVGKGLTSELEPIVFKDVYPLYAAADIRGSSDARNRAIREDLTEHLTLALEVLQAAAEGKSFPLLHELAHSVRERLGRIHDGLHAGDEMSVLDFLKKEIEPIFPLLATFGPLAEQAIQAFEAGLDRGIGTVYRKRKEFEESVSILNERISTYLDLEEAEAQELFPHYFDKHQTDGIQYLIYIGASMAENGGFDPIFARNLRLWQMMVSCGIAWHAEQLKSSLKVQLSVTHLILVTHTPLAISFRFDEKRFDVDGAYNIGHEIVRSRIDKAMVKGEAERLTQPGKLAIIYSAPGELEEITRHIKFLKTLGHLTGKVEFLELEDLPDVYGLKALRVAVNLESAELAARAMRMTA
jgi:GAF domain-containing protein